MKNLIRIALTAIISVFTYSINVPQVYKEKSMKLDGYKMTEQEINLKNGKAPSKLVVYYKNGENNEIEAYFNIYEQSKLVLQSEKKIKYSFNFIEELSSTPFTTDGA